MHFYVKQHAVNKKLFLLVFVALDATMTTHKRLRRNNVARERGCALLGAV